MWTEKHRPKVLDQCVGLPPGVHQLHPHNSNPIIFYGPSGTGKTTVCYCLARSVCDPKTNILELNASDSRNASNVLTTMKSFAQGVKDKVLILDECDSMALEAQDILCAVIDLWHRHTWFLITCNDLSGLTAGLRSRCRLMYFPPLELCHIEQRLRQIQREESIVGLESKGVDEDHILSIAKESEGDLRRAINLLETRTMPPQELLQKACILVKSAKDLSSMMTIVDNIYEGGWDIQEWMLALGKVIAEPRNSELHGWISILGTHYTNFSQHALSSKLQFHALVSRLWLSSQPPVPG